MQLNLDNMKKNLGFMPLMAIVLTFLHVGFRLSHEDRMDGWGRPIALEQKDDGTWYVISRSCFPHDGLRLEMSALVKPGVERKESVSVRDVGD